MKLFIAALLVSLVYSNKLERRIVDGYRTSAKPWMVRLEHPNKSCVGTLYTNCAIITVAQCGRDYTEDWEAHLNRYNLNLTTEQEGGSTHPVLEIAQHPSYDRKVHDWDVSVWRIDNDSADRTIVDLDDGTETKNKNLMVYALGWGWTQRLTHEEILSGYDSDEYSQYLLEARLPLVEESKCSAKYQGKLDPDTEMCTGSDNPGPSVCAGDSGGPIYRKRHGRIILMGIISKGWDCGYNVKYNVHTKVSNVYITNFINNRVREFVAKNQNKNNRNPTNSGSNPILSQSKDNSQGTSPTRSQGSIPNFTSTQYFQTDYMARIQQSHRDFLENIRRRYQIDIPDFI